MSSENRARRVQDRTRRSGQIAATFPSAAADRAVLAALEEDAAGCDLTTQWSVPGDLVSEANIIGSPRRLGVT
jgi:hypothetical protein